ncbi:hypothetical protein GCM10011490_14630 [Pseudoclavibacter endophyticus]|uniref:DUF7847 domain-containing protein n=1 Tax=Pseudoclavibacter endophyticus TaxID=1778590 RepID=A0A6H9WQT0_9MICO|nr:hypothetical protein [Pseudoclavibacter endophyticus]KAB1649145.1 hypothetical protein F8O04_02360 [Pseudoclavibacter endophyticus]GGA65057.1 hypothetical protein GCM10011490_14630 [Pseudoclavibacter endophyticus]
MTYPGMHHGTGGAASWLDHPREQAPAGAPGIGGGARPDGGEGTPAGAGTASRHAWSAPLKPGLFPLRPLQFGDIFAATFRLLRTSPGVTVGSSMIILSLISIVTGVATGLVAYAMFERAASASAEDRPALETTAITVTFLTAFASVILSLLGSALLQGILAHVVARAALGEKITFGGSWRVAFRRLWPLLGFTAIITGGTIVVLGLMAVVVAAPAMIAGFEDIGIVFSVLLALLCYALVFAGSLALTTKLLFAPAAIVLERRGPIQAIVRSWKLTRRHFWRVLGITLLVQVVAGFAAGAVSGVLQVLLSLITAVLAPLGAVGEGQEWMILAVVIVVALVALALQLVVSALTLVLSAGNAVILYVDVRMRKEGLNVHLQRAREDAAAGLSVDDPYLTPPVELEQELAPPQPATAQAAYPAPGGYAPGYAPAGYAPGYSPAGYAPSGYAPSGYAPAGPAPAGYAPAGPAPAGYPPTGYEPSGYAPSGYAPSGYAPSGYAPSGPAPAGYAPSDPAPTPSPHSQPAPPAAEPDASTRPAPDDPDTTR